MKYRITQITQEQAAGIINERNPFGLFYLLAQGLYIGIDNSTGNAWTEEFSDLQECEYWLINPPIVIE